MAEKVVIASGKGGVGKSMLASVLAMLFAKEKQVVTVDADVDAPNLHLWLGQQENWDKTEKISVSEKPIIDQKKCDLCGQCVEICAFGALSLKKNTTNHYLPRRPAPPRGEQAGSLITNHYFCEGCGACEIICPQKAIKMKRVFNAEVKTKFINYQTPMYRNRGKRGFYLVSAQLYPGESGSGKIVDLVKQKAENFNHEIMILDSPAGTGCPVIAAINGANFAILVTEPTPSGFSDLKRVLTVINHFKIPFGVVINKWDINPKISQKIKNWSREKLLGRITYDQRIFKAISQLKPIIKTNLPVKKEIEIIYQRLLRIKKGK